MTSGSRIGHDDRVERYRAKPHGGVDLDDDASTMVQEQIARIRHFFGALDATGSRVLDLGCGPGYFLDEMKIRGYTNVTGVTLSPGDIKNCEDKGHIIKKYDLSSITE